MGKLKQGIGTPLAGTGLLDDWHLAKARALSVTTVEDLLGIVAANPQVIGGFFEVSDLTKLQADAALQASAMVIQAQREVSGERFSLGAAPPDDAPVAQLALSEPIEDLIAEPIVGGAAPPAAALQEAGLVIDLRGCAGPVKDQGSRGTCVAHACCALMECLHRNETHFPAPHDYSEQYAYWNAKQHDSVPNLEGTFIRVALDRWNRDGVCVEALWPYNPIPVAGNEGQGPPPNQAHTDASRHLLLGIERLDARSSQEIRQVLDSGRPVAISVPVYDSWLNNPTTNATGLIDMPAPFSVLKGGHAMCVMGYGFDADDVAGGWFFIVRNSWGTRWARLSPFGAGYGVVPFAYVDAYGWEAFTGA